MLAPKSTFVFYRGKYTIAGSLTLDDSQGDLIMSLIYEQIFLHLWLSFLFDPKPVHTVYMSFVNYILEITTCIINKQEGDSQEESDGQSESHSWTNWTTTFPKSGLRLQVLKSTFWNQVASHKRGNFKDQL